MPVTIQPTALRYKNDQGEFQTADCLRGERGPQGLRGPAPVRGTDYWTAADQAAIEEDMANYADGIVKVQDAEPTNPENKIWIAETAPNSILVPTNAEMQNELIKLSGLMAIVVDGNTTQSAISVGKIICLRNHSDLADGLYIATATISPNGSVTNANTQAISDGGLNYLNANTVKVKQTNALADGQSISYMESGITLLLGQCEADGFMYLLYKFGSQATKIAEIKGTTDIAVANSLLGGVTVTNNSSETKNYQVRFLNLG